MIDNSNPIAAYLELAKNISSGKQQKFFQYQLDNLQPVRMDPIPLEYQKYIKKYCYPKNCWNNSAKLTQKFPETQYCEGWILVQGIPIEHAWNRINGRYFDPTIKDEVFEYYLVGILNQQELKPILKHQLWEISTPLKIWFYDS